jgi:ATP adenylyltransferase
MDYLWSPWRYKYVSEAGKTQGCVFCEKVAQGMSRDRENLVLFRGSRNFILLNLFPYTTGHSMVVPYQHTGEFADLPPETLTEMFLLTQKLHGALHSAYHPEGYNLGMNLGKCAGAGVADHVHLHVLPRWVGDTNFMTVTGETRVQPEDLSTTYKKLVAGLGA